MFPRMTSRREYGFDIGACRARILLVRVSSFMRGRDGRKWWNSLSWGAGNAAGACTARSKDLFPRFAALVQVVDIDMGLRSSGSGDVVRVVGWEITHVDGRDGIVGF